MAQFCTKCGNEIQPGSKFCMKCGTPVETPNNQTVSEITTSSLVNNIAKDISAEPTTVTTSRISKLKVAAITITLLVVSSLGSYFFFSYQIANGAGGNVPTLTDVDSIPVTKVEPLKDMATIIAKGEVNLREAPTTNSTAIGMAREGDQVEVLEKATCNDSTAAIVVNNDIYYSDGRSRTTLGKGTPVQIVSEGNGYYVVRFVVNGRTITDKGSSSYFTKLYGTTWYRVTGNGYTGWIYSAYARMN